MTDDPTTMSLNWLATLAASKFCRHTAYWKGGWRNRQLAAAAQRAQIDITIFDLGPVVRMGEAFTTEPQELTRFSMLLMKVSDETEIKKAAGFDVQKVLRKETTWGVQVDLSNIQASELDPSSGQSTLEVELLKLPIAGPYLPDEPSLLPHVIADLSALLWLGVQQEVLAERAVLDIKGLTASDEALRYLRRYCGTRNQNLAGVMMLPDAVLRDYYLTLARELQHIAPEKAAEYAQTVSDMLCQGSSVIISAPNYTFTTEPEATSIDQEFGGLRKHRLGLRALTGRHVAWLSNQMEEGLAVWRGEFIGSVLLLQEVIQPLPFTPAHLIRKPIEVLEQYENLPPDSDYIVGFRYAATAALTGSPWLLSSAPLAAAVLRVPLELLKTRLPASAFLRVQPDSLFAPNERLRQLAQLGVGEKLEELVWIERVYDSIGATTPPIIDAVVRHVIKEQNEGGLL